MFCVYQELIWRLSLCNSDLTSYFDQMIRREKNRGGFEKTMELADWSDIADIFKERHYNDITEDIFKEELQKTMKWATTYGAGFVGENYFIYNILRMKHYNLDKAKELLNTLIENGIVVRNPEVREGREFSCLSLNEGEGEAEA